MQTTRGRIVKTWKFFDVVLVVSMLAAGTTYSWSATAANPVAATPSPEPSGAAICTYACYCAKPMPCLGCLPCGGTCVPYCGKPMPCLSCLPCDGICVPYCCKPMPCLCTPIARPDTCEMRSCVGVGR